MSHEAATITRRIIPCMANDIIPPHAFDEDVRALSEDACVDKPRWFWQRAKRSADALQQQALAVPKQHTFVRFVLPVLAVLFIVAGSVLVYMAYKNNVAVHEQVTTYAANVSDSGEEHTTGQTNSSSPASGGNSTSASSGGTTEVTDPTRPRHLMIPSIGVSASATEVGVNSKNEIGTPASIKQVAWYNGSSPFLDKAGTSILVGHRGVDTYPGVFYKLASVKKGAKIVVTMGDGKTINYEAENTETVPATATEMSKYMSYLGNTKRVLYLISCQGEYDAATHSYPDRVIVKAVESE